MKTTTKVFQSGRSQAVRIPKCFRFQTNTVNIRKQGESIILTPQSDLSWDDFFAHHTCPDFELDRKDSQVVQERELFE